MNFHSSSKKPTSNTVFFTLILTAFIIIVSALITTQLYQQNNTLSTQWSEYKQNTAIKQQLTNELSHTFSTQGLLGEIRRYTLSPSSVGEDHIRSLFETNKVIVSDYKHLTNLSTTETRLLMDINRELSALKNSFFLATTFADQNKTDNVIEIGERLSGQAGQESVDKLTAFNTKAAQFDNDQIENTFSDILWLVIASLVLIPVVLLYAIYYWVSRHNVSSNVLALSNRSELDKMFRFSAVPTVIVNRSGDIVNANAAICDLTGYPMSHLLSKHLEQLVNQAPSGFLNQIMNLTEMKTQSGNSALLTNKGQEIRVQIDITQMIEGVDLLSIVSFRDIENAQKTLELKESKQEMFSFTETAHAIGSWRWDFNNDRLLWSSMTYDIYGFDESDKEVTQEFILSCIPSNERESVSNAINEAVIFGTELDIDHHIEQQDGTLLFVHQHGCVTNDQNGKPRYMLGTIKIVDENNENNVISYMSDRVFNSSLEAMAVTNQHNIILKVNDAFIDLTGFSAKEAIGQELSSVNRATFFDQYIYNKINQQVQNNHSWAGELWNVKKDGEVYPTSQHICALAREDNNVTRYLCTFRDISEQKSLEEHIINSRAVDRVTMLPSRSVLQDRLNQSIKRHERDGNQSAVLVISFKPLIAEASDLVHSQIIKALAHRLTQITRDHDTIARFGRYEFAVLLEGLALGEDAYVVADKIQIRLNEPLILEHETVIPETAIGISLHPLHATNDDSLIQYADAAMQQAKLAHNSNIQTFNQHILGIYNSSQHLNTQLQRAIDLKELAVNYQPAIEFTTQHIVRCIAHVRWHHRAYNSQDTQKFIDAAKDGTLSKPLHDWLLDNAIKYATQWSNSGLLKLELQIKIVAAQLIKPGFSQQVFDTLNTYQFPANQLVLEVSHDTFETFAQDNKPDLDALTDVGIRLLVVNLPSDPNVLLGSQADQALMQKSVLSDPQLPHDISSTSKLVISNMKETDIYPNHFDWQHHTYVSSYKDIKTHEETKLLICGSLDSENLILLGNQLKNAVS